MDDRENEPQNSKWIKSKPSSNLIETKSPFKAVDVKPLAGVFDSAFAPEESQDLHSSFNEGNSFC